MEGFWVRPHSPSRTTVLRPVSSRYVSVLPQVTTTRNTRTATSLVCLSDLQSKFNRFLRFLSWACLGQTIVSQQKAESECWKYCCVFCFGTRPVRPLPWNCRCETPFFPSQPPLKPKKDHLLPFVDYPDRLGTRSSNRNGRFVLACAVSFRFVWLFVRFVLVSCRVVSVSSRLAQARIARAAITAARTRGRPPSHLRMKASRAPRVRLVYDATLFWVFPMFVPSLSWQNHPFYL